MTTRASMVQVNGLWFTLTIAPEGSDKIAYAASGGCGQGDLMRALSSIELARSEMGRPKRVDHVHLSRFDKTDLVQWYGRHADGYHRPIGRIMQIVNVKAPRATPFNPPSPEPDKRKPHGRGSEALRDRGPAATEAP